MAMPSPRTFSFTRRRRRSVMSTISLRWRVEIDSVIRGCECMGTRRSLPRTGKAPIFGQGIGGVLGIVAGPAAGVAQVRVRQFVGDDPADEGFRTCQQRSLEDNGSRRLARFRRESYRDVHHYAGAGLVVAHREGG